MILPFDQCGPVPEVAARYFRNTVGVWKITPDGDAFIRANDSPTWTPSIFCGGLHRMMEVAGAEEITAEEGEPAP